MFGTLIAGVDGRAGGTDAVALARSLAAPDARILLAHAYPHPDVAEEARELLGREDADERCEPRPVLERSPARALHDLAESEGADLVVIGSSRHSAAGRALAGDVTRGVMHGAPCPVAVATPGTSGHARLIRTVGVGVDDDAPARAALAFAAGLARDHEATLRLLTAVHAPVAFSPAYAYTYDWTGLLEEDRRAARAMLEEQAAGLDLPTVVDVETGNADEQLEALSKAVDLLVVGSRGWGAFRRVVLGSTSDHVVRHASCPVIVVPAPGD